MIPPERELLASLDAHVIEIEGACDAEILAAGRECDALMIVSAYLPAPVIAQLSRCRVISRLGTGTDKVDVAAATRQGIYVTNLPDFCTEEVADHTLALLLAAARQLKYLESCMRAGHQPTITPAVSESPSPTGEGKAVVRDRRGGLRAVSENPLPSGRGQGVGSAPSLTPATRDPRPGTLRRLSTQTLGLIGLGRIGRAVARRARGFGFRLLVCDPGLTPEGAAAEGATLVDLPTLLAESDYVALLCPLTPATAGLLTLREFRQMQPSAVLVNTARGELVNERDLALALATGVIRYAALDVYGELNVFAAEGFPTDHPLFGLENVLMTPHCAAASEESLLEQRVGGAQAVVEVLTGHPPTHPVNPEVQPWWV